jgi:hypothetical protein
MRYGIYCALCLAVFFTPFIVLAQSYVPPRITSPLIVSVEPKDIIEPNTEATVSVGSFMVDLNRLPIAWYVDDASLNTSAKTITVPVGKLGSQTTVMVVVQNGNEVLQERVVLRPAELELLWEGDGYVPPLYRGRTLGSPGTNIVVHAEARFVRANGTRILPQDIVYTWSINGQALGSVSGREKQDAYIPITGLFGSDVISVEAVSVDGSFRASRTVRIPSVEPKVVLYRVHPLLGVDFGKAIGEQSVFSDQEITVAAFPYFSRSKNPTDKGLSYTWTVDGSHITKDIDRPFLLTLSLAEKTFGAASVEVVLSNAYSLLQAATGRWFIGLSEDTKPDPNNLFPTQ